MRHSVLALITLLFMPFQALADNSLVRGMPAAVSRVQVHKGACDLPDDELLTDVFRGSMSSSSVFKQNRYWSPGEPSIRVRVSAELLPTPPGNPPLCRWHVETKVYLTSFRANMSWQTSGAGVLELYTGGEGRLSRSETLKEDVTQGVRQAAQRLLQEIEAPRK